MTSADLHPCEAGCGRDLIDPGVCDRCGYDQPLPPIPPPPPAPRRPIDSRDVLAAGRWLRRGRGEPAEPR